MSAPATFIEGLVGQSNPIGASSKRPLYAPPDRLLMPASTLAADTKTRRPFDENDERVYFDKQSGNWRYEVEIDDGGGEMEWDSQKNAWVSVLDEEALKAQQAAYSVEGVDEETPAAPVLRREKKRRREGEAGSSKPPKQVKARINSSIYITGLPLDCTKEEIANVYSRYGVLNEDDAGEARVKMYADEKTGMFKGEALVSYFKPESVELAIRLLDDTCLRAAEGKSVPVMKVQKAEFGNAKTEQKELNKADHEKSIRESQDNKAQPKVRTEAEKRKAQKRFAKMNNKLTDWNSDSDSDTGGLGVAGGAAAKSEAIANIRQVCLRRMFTLAELDDDPTLLLDLKEDVREECETLGKVTNVVLWDKEPEGIMTVKFGSHEAALACVQKMNDRFFGGRQVIAHLLEGKARFRRSGRGDGDGQDEDDEGNGEVQRRQDAFGDWLDAGGDE